MQDFLNILCLAQEVTRLVYIFQRLRKILALCFGIKPLIYENLAVQPSKQPARRLIVLPGC